MIIFDKSRFIFLLFNLIWLLVPTPVYLQLDTADRKYLRVHGDIILGGIFPMHEQIGGRTESPCGAVKEEKGVQRLEAMLYAMDEINDNDKILPNVTLGALIIDSCSSDTYALEQSMEFVRSYMNQDMSEYKCESGIPPVYIPHKPVTAVIGASFSVVSIMIANILRLFKIPQVSYASTSTELSDKSRFEYFSRVVPPDNFQAQAIVSIIRELGWKYVSTVAVEGEYGEKGIASFISHTGEAGICIASSEKVSRNSKPEDFDRIIEKLASKLQARAVVLFVDEDNTRKLLQASIRANQTEHFLWIGSDSWGAKVHPVRDQEWAAEGAITILPHRNNIKEFDVYYKSLRPKSENQPCSLINNNNIREKSGELINCRNGWFREFWSQHNKCTFGNNNKSEIKCTGQEEITNYEQEGLVPFVVDAVYAAAHAIHNLIIDVCGEPFRLCEELRPAPPGPQILKYLRNVSFIGRQRTEVRFNSDGDPYGSYSIYQYQKIEEGKYDYKEIGSWKEALHLNVGLLQWRDSKFTPKSTCSDPCPSGHIRNFQDHCCWVCVPCREDAYVHNDTCCACSPGFAPDVEKIKCEKLKALVIDWLNPWALVPLIFSAVGIFSTIFTVGVFIRYNRTPVIMASGRELCYVLLTGILLCYGMSFVILANPTSTTCAMMRIGLGLCLSICYSAIFTKTNRISRIFNRGVKTIKRPVYTSPCSQVAIALGMASVQLIGAIVWLIIDRPDVRELYPYPLTAVLTCRVSTFALIMSLVYNIILIIMCTWYAFKTRKIPENFNEAKYIGFTMYSTCIVWLAFLPIYFGTNNDYKIQIVSMCMCLNISATVALGCLFTPKVYLVIFQPYKNVRQANNGAQGLAAQQPEQKPSYNMRFTGPPPPRSATSHSMQSLQSFTKKPVEVAVASPSIEESSLS